jgi:hypothetical protein
MRNLICLLALMVGGTAFAQSQPAPAGRPAQPSGTPTAEQDLAEARQRADETRLEVVRIAASLDRRRREIRELTTRVVALEAANGTTTTTPTNASTTTVPAPTDPAPPPNSGTIADRLAEIERRQTELGSILFDLDAHDPSVMAAAVGRWHRDGAGIEAYVVRLGLDIATIKSRLDTLEARPVVTVEAGGGALALFASPKIGIGLNGETNVGPVSAAGEFFARVGGQSQTSHGGLELLVAPSITGPGTRLCATVFGGTGPLGNSGVRFALQGGYCHTRYVDIGAPGYDALTRTGFPIGATIYAPFGKSGVGVRCSGGVEPGRTRVFKDTERLGGGSTSGYAGCGLSFSQVVGELRRRD